MKQLRTPRDARRSTPDPATSNLLQLSRQLRSTCKKGNQGGRFRTSVTLPNQNDEQLQLGALFLKHLSDPLAIIEVVVEMRRKAPQISMAGTLLDGILAGCFEDWLHPYILLQIEYSSSYPMVLAASNS